jgi:hypothetical protein
MQLGSWRAWPEEGSGSVVDAYMYRLTNKSMYEVVIRL